MCTLLIARDVVLPRSVLLAANRDENPGRPTDPPLVLSDSPRIAGGRDRLAGGTWLAVREGPAAVALLNRRDASGSGRAAQRSRGLLTLDVAAAPPEKARARALELVTQTQYAPFSLVYATPRECWILVNEGGAPRVVEVTPGWHVLTHQELDDPTEPRAAYLAERFSRTPPSPANAEAAAIEILREHGEHGTPPVCLHDGRMVTVSSSIVFLSEAQVRYAHAEGRPCEHEFRDQSRLLEAAPTRHS
jgi:uncharacterized protein with NRDE domain